MILCALPRLVNYKKDFNNIRIGDTYEKIVKISPDMYTYKELGNAPEKDFFSYLYTKDGYCVRFAYTYVGEGEFKFSPFKPHPYDHELAISEIKITAI